MIDTATFVISESLCAAYCNLLQRDFTVDYVRKKFHEDLPQGDFSDFESKLARFHDGLEHKRLELAGSSEDVSDWLRNYIVTYINPDDPYMPFSDNWDTLSATEQQEVRTDAVRLSRILRTF